MSNKFMITLLFFINFVLIQNASISVAQYFYQTTFSDSQGWGVIGATTSFDTQLGKSIFGGTNGFAAGVTIYKQITLPPNHHTIRIKLRTWAINKWENEYILIKVDGQIVNRQLVNSGLKTNFAQYLYQEIFFFHQAPSMLLEISSTLDETSSNESWGVRDIEIIALDCPSPCEQCVYTDTVETCSTLVQFTNDFTNLIVDGNEGWIVQDYPVTQKYCDKISLFGYYPSGTSIYKQYQFTQTYYKALIKFQFWKIDAVANSLHYLYINGNLVWTYDATLSKQISLCQSSSIKEEYQNVQIEVIMNSQMVLLQFDSDNTANEYYGIRDLYIYIETCIPENIVCEGDASTQAADQIILDFTETITDLIGSSFTIPTQWKSYQQTSALTRIGQPACSFSTTVIKYMSLYDILFKDFILGDHKTIKMIFYLYSQRSTNTVKLQVDDSFSQDISLGYSGFTLNCASTAANTKFEQYILYGIELPHTGSLARIQFNSDPYPGSGFRQGFNKFEIYTGNCDCATCTATGACATTYSLVDIDFALDALTSDEGWQIITYGISLSTCDSQQLLGGYTILGKAQQVRVLYSIPTHKSIRIQMKVYFLHQWVSTEHLVMQIDSVEFWRQNAIYTNFASKTCGNVATSYQIIEIDQYLTHSNNDLVINIFIDGGSGDEYWGVNNFKISYSLQDVN